MGCREPGVKRSSDAEEDSIGYRVYLIANMNILLLIGLSME